jgi:hypothetical protein
MAFDPFSESIQVFKISFLNRAESLGRRESLTAQAQAIVGEAILQKT